MSKVGTPPSVGVAHELTVVYESGIRPVVGDQASEAEAELGVLLA